MHRLILSVVFLFVLAFPVSAHPGGTDGNGGHYDHSTGEYHYHHGYGPHEHEDLDGDGDLDCPYNFKDKTGENSGESSGSTTRYPAYTRPTVPLPTKSAPTVSAPEQESFLKTVWEIVKVIGIVIVAFVVMLLWMMFFFAPVMAVQLAVHWFRERFCKRRKEREWKPGPQRIPTKPVPPPKPPESPKIVPLDDKTRLDQFLMEYNPTGIIKVEFPPELRMAEDGTLYWGTRTPDKPFGSGTAYITGRSGRCWHMKCGCSGASNPIFMLAALRKYRPCGICVPSQFRSLQVPDWYDKYTRLRSGHFRPRQLSFFNKEDG